MFQSHNRFLKIFYNDSFDWVTALNLNRKRDCIIYFDSLFHGWFKDTNIQHF